jgi:hypothetical protein
MPLCDICNRNIEFSAGYALTTRQVVGRTEYWAFMLQQHAFDDDLFGLFIQQQIKQVSGWLVCESCSPMFEFETVQARFDAYRQSDPAGCGAVELDVAGVPAARAWYKKYGCLPTWIKAPK